MLVEAGYISPEQLGQALAAQKRTGLRLGQTLLQMGLVTEEAIIEVLGRQMNIPYVNLDTYAVDTKVIDIIPQSVAEKFLVLPLFKIADTLTVAMVDPLNVLAIDEVRRLARCEVDLAVATENQMRKAIEHYYRGSGSFTDIVREIESGDLQASVKPGEAATESPVIRLVNLIMRQAIQENASDIHIEPDETKLGIRYRIDGILYEIKTLPKTIQAPLLSRLKVMAQMDIAESRVPQDGRTQMRIDDRDVELRVSTFPTLHGENVVIRVLDQSKTLLKLTDLGFPDNLLAKYKKALAAPYGIILVTGPTGSGKTTTLYASLNEINSPEKNIITIEDPIEYRLNLVRQAQINPRAGLTFASGLRSILRQDPDVIMVGEMRDVETCEIAYQAALTGHQVFSTLHTNDAAGALARLLHLGIEPFLIASSTVAVLAQRLVRTICPNCKTPYKPTPAERATFHLEENGDLTLYRGKGCKMCRGSGYRGRIGIYELLMIDSTIQQLILNNASAREIREAARATQGMTFLREEGIARVLQGVTTLEEVGRLTFEE